MAANSDRPAETGRTVSAARLIEVVSGLLAELRPSGGDTVQVTLDSVFDRDLGLDSLSRVELIARVESAFGAALPESVLGEAETPRDLLRALSAAAGQEKSAATREIESVDLGRVETLPIRARTLVEAFDWHAAAHPDRPHIRLYADDGDGEILTYDALREAAAGIATGLLDRGLVPGETVMLMLPTGRDYFVSFLGVLMAGGTPVPIYPPARMTQIGEHLSRHAGIAANCRAAIMITVPEATKLGGLLKARAESVRHVVTPQDLETSGGNGALPAPGPGDIAFLQYTSGSTGAPKGVSLTHANLLANVRAMGRALQANADDVVVSWLPLYHDMGLIGAWLGSLYHAAHFVVMPPLAFLGRPSRWLTAIHRYRGTISAAPNFAYEMCLRRIPEKELEGLDLKSWRIAANGAEPVSPDTLRRFCERFEPLGFKRSTMMPMFGLAENCVGLAFPPLDRGPLIDRVQRATLAASGRAEPAAETTPEAEIIEFVACGRPIPGHEIRIADSTGRELPERTEGRLEFRGPSATAGYYRNPEATRALFDGEWLDSGDRAYIADADVYITGRAKDIIIRAGRNIYPSEIEDAAGEIDGIIKGNVAVFGVAGAESGTERLVVLAETRRRDPEAQEKIRTALNGLVTEMLGSPADEVVLAPPNTVPKTSSGKIRRASSRDIYVNGLIGKPRPPVWKQVAREALAGIRPYLRRLGSRLSAWLFAARFWIVLCVICAPPTWLLAVLLPGTNLRWKAARTGSRLFLRLSGLLPRLNGAEYLQGVGADCVLVSNHSSYLDGCVLVAALPRPAAFVAKGELEGQFIAGTFLKRIGAVFVERFDAARSVSDAERITEAAGGRPLLYFPEGTLSRIPGLLPFQMGAFAAAARAGLPMVPLAVRGTRNVLRDGSWFPRRGRITVTAMEPVHPDAAETDRWKAAVALRGEVRRRMLRQIGEPDLEHFPILHGLSDRGHRPLE